jgi:integrase
VQHLELPAIEHVERAQRPSRLPEVFTPEEARVVLSHMEGTPRLMASLLYGGGLRLMEYVWLRVKDVDFAQRQITVREGKGELDQRTPQRGRCGLRNAAVISCLLCRPRCRARCVSSSSCSGSSRSASRLSIHCIV